MKKIQILVISFIVIGMWGLSLSADINYATMWNNVKDTAKTITAPIRNSAKQIKSTGNLAVHAIVLAKSVQEEASKLAELTNSLKHTLSNLGKTKSLPTQKIIFENAMDKAGELLNRTFSLLYEVNFICDEAVGLKIISAETSDQFRKVLFTLLAFTTTTMTMLREQMGPELLDFMNNISNISMP